MCRSRGVLSDRRVRVDGSPNTKYILEGFWKFFFGGQTEDGQTDPLRERPLSVRGQEEGQTGLRSSSHREPVRATVSQFVMAGKESFDLSERPGALPRAPRAELDEGSDSDVEDGSNMIRPLAQKRPAERNSARLTKLAKRHERERAGAEQGEAAPPKPPRTPRASNSAAPSRPHTTTAPGASASPLASPASPLASPAPRRPNGGESLGTPPLAAVEPPGSRRSSRERRPCRPSSSRYRKALQWRPAVLRSPRRRGPPR